MKFYKNKEELGFDDVSIVPQTSPINSRKQINLLRKFGNIEAIPLLVSNMFTIGTIKAAKTLFKYSIPVCLHKGYSDKELIDFFKIEESYYSFISLGLDELSKTKEWLLKHKKLVILDVAHGGMTKFIDYVKYIKDKYPDCFLVAGNVITQETTEALCMAGADCIKVNIGVSNACSTKNKTGVFRKPLSALLDCQNITKIYKKLICSDGGFLEPGHLAVAYHAGADLCMSGSLFAGFKELSEGNTINSDNFELIEYYGSSSKKANNKYFGGLSSYRASEGNDLLIPTIDFNEGIQDILGGLRSYCSYVGKFDL